MKSAKQVREYVRRRWLWERNGRSLQKAAAFLEVLNAFDTSGKEVLKMPPLDNDYADPKNLLTGSAHRV